MYDTVLTLHSWIRWLVLIAGIAAVGRAALGWMTMREWTVQDQRLGLLFMIGVDAQILLGLILYVFLSPITANAFADFRAAMSSDTSRFFTVDHILLMIAAVALVHAGRILPRRTAEAAAKHRNAAILFGIALLAILVAIPWDRPLFRLG